MSKVIIGIDPDSKAHGVAIYIDGRLSRLECLTLSWLVDALDFYHGVIRAVDEKGDKILHDIDYQHYLDYIGEEVKSWSYMKFPFLKSIGTKEGWYRVGPLARLNTCDFIPSPLAQKEFEEYISAFFQCGGCYVERNLIEREERKEILELDIVATNYNKKNLKP